MRSTSIGSSCVYGVLHDGCCEPSANPTLLKMKHLINIPMDTSQHPKKGRGVDKFEASH